MTSEDIRCKRCNRKPDEIQEYIDEAYVNNTTPMQYVHSEEGTYNFRTGKFYCTNCYIALGMPLGTA